MHRFLKSIEYIETNLFEKLSPGEIARAACFSTFHYCRMFKALHNPDWINFRKPIDQQTLEHLQSGVSMEPKCVEKESFQVIGINGTYTRSTTQYIPTLWQQFRPQIPTIQNRIRLESTLPRKFHAEYIARNIKHATYEIRSGTGHYSLSPLSHPNSLVWLTALMSIQKDSIGRHFKINLKCVFCNF